LNKST